MFRAYWPRTRFYLVVREGRRPISLNVVLRIPDRGPIDVPIVANGATIGIISASRDWSATTIELPVGGLQLGVNRLELHFPVDPDDRGQLRRIADAMREGRLTDFYPVFGEIHRFVASVVANGES